MNLWRVQLVAPQFIQLAAVAGAHVAIADYEHGAVDRLLIVLCQLRVAQFFP